MCASSPVGADDVASGAQGIVSPPSRRQSPSDSQLLQLHAAATKSPTHAAAAASSLARTHSAAARDNEQLREKASRLVKPFLVPQIVSDCCNHLDQFGACRVMS